RPTTRAVPSSASPATSATTCLTHWSHAGTESPVGVVDGIHTVEFDGQGGHLAIAFWPAISRVRKISIEPARPPFVDGHGKAVSVQGEAFYWLSLDGLTRPTLDTPSDLVAAESAAPFTSTVAAPIVEARRIQSPANRSPVGGPKADSTET